jgi:hypothetical protein
VNSSKSKGQEKQNEPLKIAASASTAAACMIQNKLAQALGHRKI